MYGESQKDIQVVISPLNLGRLSLGRWVLADAEENDVLIGVETKRSPQMLTIILISCNWFKLEV